MLEVVPLGGLGEFGMNMLALSWGETTIVVDAGVMFPDPELLGVDRIIPDLTYLEQRGRAAARHRRTVRDRVHPRHAQHARLRGARDPHARGRRRPLRRLQDRPDAD